MALTLGGKSPADKPKKKPFALLTAKKSAPEAATPPEPMEEEAPEEVAPPPTAGLPEPPTAALGKLAKDAHFVDQTQTCSTCEYFDDAGNGGVGACTKGVPEADYSVADPTASRCRFYEGKEAVDETPAEEAAEMEEMPA